MMVVLFRLTSRSANNLMSQTAADSRAFFAVSDLERVMGEICHTLLFAHEGPVGEMSVTQTDRRDPCCSQFSVQAFVSVTGIVCYEGRKTPFPGKVFELFHIIGTFWNLFSLTCSLRNFKPTSDHVIPKKNRSVCTERH